MGTMLVAPKTLLLSIVIIRFDRALPGASRFRQDRLFHNAPPLFSSSDRNQVFLY